MGQYSTLLLISPTVLSRIQGRDEPFTHLKKSSLTPATCWVRGTPQWAGQSRRLPPWVTPHLPLKTLPQRQGCQ